MPATEPASTCFFYCHSERAFRHIKSPTYLYENHLFEIRRYTQYDNQETFRKVGALAIHRFKNPGTGFRDVKKMILLK